MKITGTRQNSFLKSPPLDIIGVLFFGPDRGLAKIRAAELAQKFLSDDGDSVFNTTILTADDIAADMGRLSDEMRALSLLGGDRVIRLKLDHERQGQAIAKLIQSFDSTPDQAEAKLIIEAGELSPRSAIRKTIEAARHFAALGCYAASHHDLRQLVKTTAAQHDISITADALDMWLPLLEGDYALAMSEIEKMILYKGYGQIKAAQISRLDIETLAAGGQIASIDEIIHFAMNGQSAECDAAFMRAIASKTNPITIFIGLQRHLLRLMEIAAKTAQGETPASAMKSLRPPVFKMHEAIILKQIAIWPETMLARSLTQCQIAEHALKSTGATSEAIISRLLLALSSYAQKRAQKYG